MVAFVITWGSLGRMVDCLPHINNKIATQSQFAHNHHEYYVCLAQGDDHLHKCILLVLFFKRHQEWTHTSQCPICNDQYTCGIQCSLLFTGKYYPLSKMTEEEQQQLIDDHLLFDKPVSPLLLASGMARDWPDARGIWHNDPKNFLIWVRLISQEKIKHFYHHEYYACIMNKYLTKCSYPPSFLSVSLTQVNEEDHIRVISMQKGGNMKEVFSRFCTGLKNVEQAMKTKGQKRVLSTTMYHA